MDIDTTHQLLLKTLGVALGFIISFILPIQAFIILVGVFVIVDLITGINVVRYKKKNGENVKITPSSFKRTVSKFRDYAIAILVSHALEIVFFPTLDTPYFAWAISGIIALTEIQSIFENLSITTGIDFWARLKKIFKDKIPY